MAEYFLNVVSKSGDIAWTSRTSGDYKYIHTLKNATWGIQVVTEQAAYLDVHAWCFVPHSFRMIIEDLFSLGLISLREVSFSETVDNEFYVILSRSGKGPQISRNEIAKTIEKELIDGSASDFN